MILTVLHILLFSSCFGHGSEVCSSLNGINRTCMHYQDCPQEIREWIFMRPKPSYILEQLRAARCGEKHFKKLCCPTPECYTWDGRPGVCVNYNKSIFGDTMSYRQIKHSRCINNRPPSICYSHLPVRQTGDCESEISAFPLDPSYGCCGKQKIFQYKLIGIPSTATIIGEHPWLAVIKYPEDKRNCSGVLISGKYVLTAAHCVDSMALNEKPYAVILGEHNKATEDDCDILEDCYQNHSITVPIEDIVVHPQFDSTSLDRRNDIALIRLEYMVAYTDFIQPVCLPIDYNDTTRNPPEDFRLWSAGWGTIDADTNGVSDVKLKVEMPYVDPWRCVNSYPKLWSYQMCAGGRGTKDSCNRDSGSPLMHDGNGVTEILGITSYGITTCGVDREPAVYTKVYSYIRWIHSTIRP